MSVKSTPTQYPGVRKVSQGKYWVRVKVKDPRTGKTREIDRVLEAARASEAAALREQLRKEVLDPRSDLGARPRMRELALSWLDGKLSELRPSTRRHYADVLDNHILPPLGDVFLDALTATDIVRWRDALPGAPASINTRLRLLKTLLADVTHEHGLPNPAARVSGVREPKRTKPRTVKVTSMPRCPANRLTAPELAAVLSQLRELTPQWYPLMLVLAVTGARWGEVAALCWEHVDLEAGVLRFEQASWRGHVDGTKTDVIKVVPMPPLLVDVLRVHRRELVSRQAKGLAAGWVFPSRVGRPHADPSAIRKPLAAALEAAEVGRWVTPHGLRRSFNNLVRQVAAGEVVRSMTGHVTEAMTEHYSHIELDEKRVAQEAALRLLVACPTPGGVPGGVSPEATKKPG